MAVLWLTLGLFAADETKEVHVYQQTLIADGEPTQLSDQTLLTGSDYTTQTAPALSGYLFTHWSISRAQAFVNRDRLGRALDSVTYHLYESTTLTANYLPEGEDTDGDGVADGWEIYWYGDLDETATSDTDGDALTFAEELVAGTNPLIPNSNVEGGIVWDDGEKLQYNPTGLMPYTIRSEPEGELFATISDYVEPGTSVTTPTCTRLTTTFSYWTCNGVRVQDRRGRAMDGITFSMPSQAVEYVAHCISDADLREQYYWYGAATSMSSDTDNDGLTLAEEIAAGTNPLMPNETVDGGIVWDQGDLLQYNPDRFHAYVIRSEPEGELFETRSDIVEEGTQVTSGTYGTVDSTFAYWTLNGVRQCDRYGRAYNQVSFTMPTQAVELVAHCVTNEDERMQFYWYGTATNMTSDTDHDGLTLAEEIAAGTNPLIPDETVEGGIVWDDGEQLETDLQVYEQVRGALVDDAYEQLFTSPIAGNAATSRTFANGTQIWPVVADVNGDGLWDLIVVSATTTNVFVNTGSKGNPQFAKCGSVGADGLGGPSVDLGMNSTEKLMAMTLDVEPVGALSATTNGATMLVSDEEGRIWHYVDATSSSRQNEDGSTSIGRGGDTASTWELQHKVWGGSYAGFAQGLRLAAVDWEDDGDLDCLCGTAEGKLMLLRDPKVGRPTGLVAEAGVDNVKLEWEPNGQSRVRGYRVYKATKATEGTEGTTPASTGDSTGEGDLSLLSFGSFTSLSQTALPTYRDLNLEPSTYAYKVSALSRFYTAGNSTPTETESIATEPVSATVGGVTLSWSEPVWRLNCDKSGNVVSSNVVVDLIINNSLNYDAAGLVVSNVYDAAKWRFLKVEATGLSEKLKWEAVDCEAPVDAASSPRREEELIGSGDAVGTPRPRAVTLAVSLGEVVAGGGKFFTFVFEDLTAEPKVLMGDVDGNGVLEGVVIGPGHAKRGDLWLLGKLKDDRGRNWTAYQLKAGDFNGNGKLDNADYQALRALLKERCLL